MGFELALDVAGCGHVGPQRAAHVIHDPPLTRPEGPLRQSVSQVASRHVPGGGQALGPPAACLGPADQHLGGVVRREQEGAARHEDAVDLVVAARSIVVAQVVDAVVGEDHDVERLVVEGRQVGGVALAEVDPRVHPAGGGHHARCVVDPDVGVRPGHEPGVVRPAPTPRSRTRASGGT